MQLDMTHTFYNDQLIQMTTSFNLVFSSRLRKEKFWISIFFPLRIRKFSVMGAISFPWWAFTSASDYVANKTKSFDIALSSFWRRQRHPTLENPMDGGAGRLQSMGLLKVGPTERLPFHFSLSWIGEGNGNPLQCSYLENPRDRGAWWAAVYGVTQSRTWLKWLSSSSSSF